MRNHKENGNVVDLSEPVSVGQKNLAKMEPQIENNNKISVVSKLLLKDSNGGCSRGSSSSNINSNSNASFSSASVAGSVQVSLTRQPVSGFYCLSSGLLALLFLLINPQKRAEFQSHG